MTVPLFTSNSNCSSWCKAWVFALVLVVLLLGAFEIFWRSKGYKPAIVDDQRLWASERSRIGKSGKEIALLGSSRMQTDISMSSLRSIMKGYSIINLSADSTCANAVLRDLAGDKYFKGIVIVETTSECLMFGDDPGLSQQFYVDYYHKTYNLNVLANRYIVTYVQKYLTVTDPYLNLMKVGGDLIFKRKLRMPNYLKTNEDRSRSADYEKLDIAHHKSMRLQKVGAHYLVLKPKISTANLMKQVALLDQAAGEIRARGGKVVFVRFPVSNEHWVIDEMYFPRSIYWDPLVAKTVAPFVHFKDVYGMRSFECPDTSHLDAKDTIPFTKILLEELRRKEIMTYDSN